MFIKSLLVGYPQTWVEVAKLRRVPWVGTMLYRFAQWLCGKLTGHHVSRTEWGYGGGDHADVWCRWCNKMGKIPRSELADRYVNARRTIWGLTGCDIRHQSLKADETSSDSIGGKE